MTIRAHKVKVESPAGASFNSQGQRPWNYVNKKRSPVRASYLCLLQGNDIQLKEMESGQQSVPPPVVVAFQRHTRPA